MSVGAQGPAEPGLDFDGPAAGAELHRQLGQILRQLHDALLGLGLMPRLAQSAQELPDARGRLEWVVRKSGEAAHRSLAAVERAQAERERIEVLCRRLGAALDGDAAAAAALGELRQASRGIGVELSDILLAQDFHDLTGQVVAKVAALALDLEANLLDLLLRSAPGEVACAAAPPPERTEPDAGRVRDQREVDELLAGLGF